MISTTLSLLLVVVLLGWWVWLAVVAVAAVCDSYKQQMQHMPKVVGKNEHIFIGNIYQCFVTLLNSLNVIQVET